MVTTHEPLRAVTRNKSQVALKAGQASSSNAPAKSFKGPTILLLSCGAGAALLCQLVGQ